MASLLDLARTAIGRCRELAEFTDEPGYITRTFLSPAMHDAHARLRLWMESCGMDVRIDAAGNLRGLRAGPEPRSRRLYIGSHIDTVPHAGAFDGVLGVVLGILLVEALGDRRLPFGIEVLAFSEEEGVRFGVPFIGSRALLGTVDTELLDCRDWSGVRLAEAIQRFGLDLARLPEAQLPEGAVGYLEFHIEQGPVLESLDLALGIVDSIAGQSRFEVVFEGAANHAGTTPAHLRRDAVAGAAEWVACVEQEACVTPDLRATVGSLEVRPGAPNVIAGWVRATLDVRHTRDEVRRSAVERVLQAAAAIGARRNLKTSWAMRLDQPATPLCASLINTVERAVSAAGFPIHHMVSGAGHDAMVLACKVPSAMLFLRSPKGISHHPDESVLPEDVAAALATGLKFVEFLHA